MMANIGLVFGGMMRKTVTGYPRVQRARADAVAMMLRFLLAMILATSLSYCSVAIEQAKAIFKNLAVSFDRPQQVEHRPRLLVAEGELHQNTFGNPA